MMHTEKTSLLTALIITTSLFGSIVGTAKSATAEVIGADNRMRPTYSWLTGVGQRQAVGQLEIQKADGKYYTCTFTVVGKNIGLTNVHCLIDSQGRLPKQIKAYSVQYGTTNFAGTTVDLFWLGRKTSPTLLSQHVQDWAAIRFRPIYRNARWMEFGEAVGWFGNEAYYLNINNAGNSTKNKYTNLIGYSGDYNNYPAAHFNCFITNTIVAGNLMHNCDTKGGASGSSLHNNQRQVMGLHWGAFTYSGSTMNGAVPLERFMPAVKKLQETGANAATIVPVP
ncbi:trypsin-like serine peptidase [Alkalinema pantanalense CENA528]|uniref:trypsin-like serine peptidase n=1 Tax=Alkalinema pantanalense TaxID=1620705 RepID=UPI003D6FC7F7